MRLHTTITSSPARAGLAALEVVLTAALTLPMAAALYFLVEEALQGLFFVIGNMVGSPFV